MRGKIDKSGWFYKENPGGAMEMCDCCMDVNHVCHWSCVAFEGPIQNIGPLSGQPTGHTIIRICQGRELVFDEFEDERVK